MAFMLVSTLWAMGINLIDFWKQDQWLLFITGATLYLLAVWLTIETVFAMRSFRKAKITEQMEIDF